MSAPLLLKGRIIWMISERWLLPGLQIWRSVATQTIVFLTFNRSQWTIIEFRMLETDSVQLTWVYFYLLVRQINLSQSSTTAKDQSLTAPDKLHISPSALWTVPWLVECRIQRAFICITGALAVSRLGWDSNQDQSWDQPELCLCWVTSAVLPDQSQALHITKDLLLW